MTTPAAETLFTVHEVARRLRVHHITVYRWIYNGTLPSLRVSGGRGRSTIRIKASTLAAIVK